MGKIYKNQTVIVQLVTDMDVSAATNTLRYRAPDNVVGTYAAPTTVGLHTVYYKTKLTKAGNWAFWVSSTWGADWIPSTPAQLKVHEEGT